MTLDGRQFRTFLAALPVALSFLAGPGAGAADGRVLTLGTTTTTENSGLMAHLLPLFTRATGIRVRLLVRGTGDVLRAARAGDVDAILAHDKAAELKLVADGFGLERRDVMVNDFVIVGPKDDPAGIGGLKDGAKALARIAAAHSRFISRGDDSGTHRAERRLWRAVAIDPTGDSGTWYLEAGAGMGATLNIAAGIGAYTMTDRGTWLAYGNRRGLAVLAEGDPRMINRYGITLIDPARHPHVNAAAARRFADWLTSAAGQRAIAAYKVGGRQAFRPNYRPNHLPSGS